MSRLERIVASVGGVVFDGGRRALIPGPGHSAHDRSVSLLIGEDGRLIVHCFSHRDDWRAVRAALKARGLLEDAPVGAEETQWAARRAGSRKAGIVVQPTQEERVARARRLWSESRPVAGTLAERYLRLRRISRDITSSDALRLHPRMTSLDDRVRRPARGRRDGGGAHRADAARR